MSELAGAGVRATAAISSCDLRMDGDAARRAPRGGHFPSLEVPDVLARDIIATLRAAHVLG
jgi:hypothetical protein